MLHTDFSQINYADYDRFFVIGCSFTNWHWPTWANIIAEQYPHMEFYNFGFPGMGNEYIQILLNQITHSEKLNSRDLVGIMWSTFHRNVCYRSADVKQQVSNSNIDYFDPDRPGNENWSPTGDMIHVQTLERDGYVDAWDDRGFVIRDCAIIDNTTTVLEHANYAAFQMMSVLPEHQTLYDASILATKKSDVYDFYSHLPSKMISSDRDIVNTLGWTVDHVTVTWEKPWTKAGAGDMELDRHPSALDWCKYLSASKFHIEQHTEDRCREADNTVQNTTHSNLFADDWEYRAQCKLKYPL